MPVQWDSVKIFKITDGETEGQSQEEIVPR